MNIIQEIIFVKLIITTVRAGTWLNDFLIQQHIPIVPKILLKINEAQN